MRESGLSPGDSTGCAGDHTGKNGNHVPERPLSKSLDRSMFLVAFGFMSEARR